MFKEGDKVEFEVYYGGRKITEIGTIKNNKIIGDGFEDELDINDKIVLNLRKSI